MTQDEFFRDLASLFVSKWRDDAECKDAWPELFFSPEYEDAAKRICQQCPVRLECLNSAITSRDKFIRGGYNEEERRSLINHQNRYHQYFEFDINAKETV